MLQVYLEIRKFTLFSTFHMPILTKYEVFVSVLSAFGLSTQLLSQLCQNWWAQKRS